MLGECPVLEEDLEDAPQTSQATNGTATHLLTAAASLPNLETADKFSAEKGNNILCRGGSSSTSCNNILLENNFHDDMELNLDSNSKKKHTQIYLPAPALIPASPPLTRRSKSEKKIGTTTSTTLDEEAQPPPEKQKPLDELLQLRPPPLPEFGGKTRIGLEGLPTLSNSLLLDAAGLPRLSEREVVSGCESRKKHVMRRACERLEKASSRGFVGGGRKEAGERRRGREEDAKKQKKKSQSRKRSSSSKRKTVVAEDILEVSTQKPRSTAVRPRCPVVPSSRRLTARRANALLPRKTNVVENEDLEAPENAEIVIEKVEEAEDFVSAGEMEEEEDTKPGTKYSLSLNGHACLCQNF